MINNLIKPITKEETYPFRFSICTLVTQPRVYELMFNSFLASGFDTEQCEYLCIDNSSHNVLDAYEGLNLFLKKAKGQYIILCHQDIVLHDDQIDILNKRIAEMDQIDSKWAILSNAGGINLKHLAMHITQDSNFRLIEPALPLKAISVDENFILVKNEANLALSSDLEGFHMYGIDICIIANLLGYNSYIIDFNLTHKSRGKVDEVFYQKRKAFLDKYRRALRGRFLSTTITRFYLTGNRFSSILLNLGGIMFLARQFYKYCRPKKHYRV